MNNITEYEYLDVDTIRDGIADAIIKESPILRRLPFQTISGNSLKYNIESTIAGGSWLSVGSVIPESAPTWAQRSADIYELIGDADVDKFVKQTNSSQDPEAAIIEKKAKGIAYDFEEAAIMGRTTALAAYSGANVPKGLLKLVAECESATTTDLDSVNNDQVIAGAADSTALTLDMMDELVDCIKPGSPDAIILSRRLRRKLNSLARAAGSNLEHDRDQLGYPVTLWGTIPVLINDFINNNFQDGSSSVLAIASYNPDTTRASGYDNSVIFAVKFGEDGFCGLTNGGIQREYFEKLETKDASRTRIKFYCGMAVFNTLTVAALINVLDTALS